jgi:aspartate/methionine/tyrosine aminotransferase
MRPKHSEYMPWAKLHSDARFNLATSGVAGFPFSELPVSIEQLQINGDSAYGYEPLQRAIANKCGVDPECVVAAAGTSMANHLAMAALLDPGDEVLIEHPTYELLTATASYLGVKLKTFARREDNGYAIDPAEILRVLTPQTRLIVLTNLHNPTSVWTPDHVLLEVGDLAKSVGGHVLVDEVYLDAVYENTPRTSYHLGPEFVVTNSLTKVYGLSGLRCGWILAQPDLARAMWRLNDLYGSIPAHPAELLSVVAFQHLPAIRERARKIVNADRVLLNDFLSQQTGVSAAPTNFGTTSFLRLRKGDVEPFLQRLHTEFETSAVPGRFFGMPNHFRIGMGVNTEMFGEGVRRIRLALAV